jgi:hypothetical protein
MAEAHFALLLFYDFILKVVVVVRAALLCG